MPSRQQYRDLALAILSGILLMVSFPRFEVSIAAWVGMVPLFVALHGKTLRQAFLLSFLTVGIFLTGAFYWIWAVPAFKLTQYTILAAYVFPLYGGLFGLILNWLQNKTGFSVAVIAPPLWVALEFLRAHAFFLSAPWILLGHSQYLNTSLIQLASSLGAYGITFLIVFVNAALADAFQYLRHKYSVSAMYPEGQRFSFVPLIGAIVILLGAFLYGSVTLSEEVRAGTTTVAVIHGDTPQDQKWDLLNRETILERYIRLSRSAAQQSPELIVWPETAVPGDIEHERFLRSKVEGLARETKSSLLVGSSVNRKFNSPTVARKAYNQLVLFSAEGKIEGYYRKILLVPFGEYTPLRGLMASTAIVPLIQDVTAGDEFTIFSNGGTAFGATICWESTFPEHFRKFVNRGADFMVNATNEAWFGRSAPYHFLAMAVFRAVENRTAVVRSTNRGISAVIDPYGRILNRLGGDTADSHDGFFNAKIPISHLKTFYTLYGDVFAFLQLALLTSMVLISWLKRPLRILSGHTNPVTEVRRPS